LSVKVSFTIGHGVYGCNLKLYARTVKIIKTRVAAMNQHAKVKIAARPGIPAS